MARPRRRQSLDERDEQARQILAGINDLLARQGGGADPSLGPVTGNQARYAHAPQAPADAGQEFDAVPVGGHPGDQGPMLTDVAASLSHAAGMLAGGAGVGEEHDDVLPHAGEEHDAVLPHTGEEYDAIDTDPAEGRRIRRRQRNRQSRGPDEQSTDDQLAQIQGVFNTGATAMQGTDIGDTLGKVGTIAGHAAGAMAGDPASIAGLVSDGIDQVKESWERAKRIRADIDETISGVASSGAKALQGGRFGDTLGGALGMPEEAGKGIQKMAGEVPIVGGIVSDMLQPLIDAEGLPRKLVESVDRLRDWNESLHASNLAFKDFSTGMAQVAAEQEVRGIYLSQERGERRAETAGRQAEAKHRLDVALAPIEDAFANLANRISAWASDTLAGGFEGVNKVLAQAGVIENDEEETSEARTAKARRQLIDDRLAAQGDNIPIWVARVQNWASQYGEQSPPSGPRRTQ